MKRLGSIAVAAAVILASFAAAQSDEPQKITRTGVGQLRLGMTHKEAFEMGLVGRKRPGCELGGPDTRSARLKAPLKGFVDLTTRRKPRRVRSISLTGGATARGVGIGSTIAQIKAAFPGAKVDHGTEEVFGITLVKVSKQAGGRFHFAVDVGTKKTTQIGIPTIPFCE